MTIGEERQPVGPIVKQPDLIVRLRAGPDEAPMLAGDFRAVAIGAGHDGRAPAFGKARNIRHLVGDAMTQDQATRPKLSPSEVRTLKSSMAPETLSARALTSLIVG